MVCRWCGDPADHVGRVLSVLLADTAHPQAQVLDLESLLVFKLLGFELAGLASLCAKLGLVYTTTGVMVLSLVAALGASLVVVLIL